jgi:DNA modification methylase
VSVKILKGDCRDVLRTLPAESVHCVVTSPPYWGLRDYGIPPSIWGEDPDCEHVWGETISVNATNHTTKARWNHTRNGRDELQPTEKRARRDA